MLHRVLHGEAILDDLLDRIDDAQGRSPASLTSLMSEVETLYSRGELRSEAYFVLKGRLDPATRVRPPPPQRQPAPQPGNPTVERVPVAPHSDNQATDLRLVAASRQETSHAEPGGEQQLEPGSIINNRFVLEERIGAGGMGVVFKARDRYREEAQDRDPYVAIKFVNADFRRHPDSLMALEREARKHMSLAHPNIMIVHDFIRNPDNTLIFLHMELLEGEPLDRLIQRHPQGLPFEDALPLIKGAGDALVYAHEKKIIHSDFKPGNVFAVESRKAKVLDFGIARDVSVGTFDDKEGTRWDAGILGAMTPAYASPEMLLNKPASPSDDIYALACVAFELMSGRHPFNGATALNAAHEGLKIKRAPGMGRSQYKALVHALAFRQAARTPSVAAFLEEFAGSSGVQKTARRRSLLTAAATVAIIGALALAILLYLRPDPDEQLASNLMERAAAQLEESNRESGRIAEIDPEMIKTLLEMGNLLLDQARNSFDPGQLSENTVSSAYGAFHSALSMDVNNRDAVSGIVEIVHLYEAEAKRHFDGGDYLEASEMARYARKIDPDRESLKDIEQNANTRLRSVTE